MFPLLTHTLPPAATTNAYLLGTGDSVLVDPGASDAAGARPPGGRPRRRPRAARPQGDRHLAHPPPSGPRRRRRAPAGLARRPRARPSAHRRAAGRPGDQGRRRAAGRRARHAGDRGDVLRPRPPHPGPRPRPPLLPGGGPALAALRRHGLGGQHDRRRSPRGGHGRLLRLAGQARGPAPGHPLPRPRPGDQERRGQAPRVHRPPPLAGGAHPRGLERGQADRPPRCCPPSTTTCRSRPGPSPSGRSSPISTGCGSTAGSRDNPRDRAASYSLRSDSIGSTRAARRAGSRQASRPAAASTAGASAYTPGSQGRTW